MCYTSTHTLHILTQSIISVINTYSLANNSQPLTHPCRPRDGQRRRCGSQSRIVTQGHFTTSSFPSLSNPDGSTAISSISKAELLHSLPNIYSAVYAEYVTFRFHSYLQRRSLQIFFSSCVVSHSLLHHSIQMSW